MAEFEQEPQSKKIEKHTREVTIDRPIHPSSADKYNEKYPEFSIRITADSGGDILDSLPYSMRLKDFLKTGKWRGITFEEKGSGDEHIILTKGDVTTPEPILVRFHSSMVWNEVFWIPVSDDREEIFDSMNEIAKAGRGIFIYLFQEGAGNRLATSLAQLTLTITQGLPMPEAFKELDVPMDSRSFTIATDALKMLEVTAPIKFLSGSPKKRKQLQDAGFTVDHSYTFKPPEPQSEIEIEYRDSKSKIGLYDNTAKEAKNNDS